MRGVVIALGMAAAIALPANAQRAAAEIALIETPAPAGAIVLGEVRAEIHQKTVIAKTPARDLADQELRVQAVKLGADAVVDIKYENSSPLFSKKGFRAAGKAVRFAAPPVQVAAVAPAPGTGRTAAANPVAAPAAQPAPPVPAIAAPVEPVIVPPPVGITTAAPAPIVAPPSQTAAVAPPPPRVEPAPAPVTQPAVQPAAAAAVPAAPRGTPEALIVLTEEDLAGRAYERLGEVTATARQTSLFPKKSARAVMDEQLRSKAAALGADAVILIRYEAYSPLLSKKGASAAGVAVKYR